MSITKQINRFLKLQIDFEAIAIQGDTTHLRYLVEAAFATVQTKKSKSRQELATIILTKLFALCVRGFRFDHFVSKILSKSEQKVFLTELLFHIYSLTFPLRVFYSSERLHSYLLQQLAAVCKSKTVKTFLLDLNLTKKVHALTYALAFYEEGSFYLARAMRYDRELSKLVGFIERGLIEKRAFYEWAKEERLVTVKMLQVFLEDEEKKRKERIQELSHVVNSYHKTDFSHVERFVNIFGLYDHQGPDGSSLVDKLSSKQDFEFFEVMKPHLTATAQEYIEGMNSVVLALPTFSRELQRLPWLESILESLELFNKFFGKCKYPIFVFDQSEKPLFIKNHRYIQSLMKRFCMPIVHLDKDAIMQLATKLDILPLIVTAPDNRFGYAGARNAVFLLAPLLHKLHSQGLSHTLSKAKLKTYFHEAIYSDVAIHMGDDDLYEPIETVFTDALFAYRYKDRYFCRRGYLVGRITTVVQASLDPYAMQHSFETITGQFPWSDSPIFPGMTGCLSKMRICLDLPYGQEEPQVRPMEKVFVDMRRPSMHLSGWRYPRYDVPTNRFAGLAGFLQKNTTYVVLLVLMERLLEPIDLSKTALIWNKKTSDYKNFKELLEAITAHETIEAMQKQFWENFQNFQENFLKQMDELIAFDIESVAFDKKLKTYLVDLKREALYYSAFVSYLRADPQRLLEKAKEQVEAEFKEPITKRVFAHALYLISISVGQGGFQKKLGFRSETKGVS
jgi:hypothetical protein